MDTSLTRSTWHRKPNARPLAHAASLPVTTLAAAAMAHWPVCGDVEVVLVARNGSPARRARLQVSIGAFVHRETYRVAHFREWDAPQDAEPINWFLISQRCLRCAEDAIGLLRNRPDLVTRWVIDGAPLQELACARNSGGRAAPATVRAQPKIGVGNCLSVFANEISHAILST